jgi:hypothetical protein
MKLRRVLSTLSATLLAGTVVATIYSEPASASSVSCYATNTGNPNGPWWFDCSSTNGTQTVWYINGVQQSEGAGASYYSWDCLKGHYYTIGVNLGTDLAATWSGNCRDL